VGVSDLPNHYGDKIAKALDKACRDAENIETTRQLARRHVEELEKVRAQTNELRAELKKAQDSAKDWSIRADDRGKRLAASEDALDVAERKIALLTELLRIRETAQIPMVPQGAMDELAACRAYNQKLIDQVLELDRALDGMLERSEKARQNWMGEIDELKAIKEAAWLVIVREQPVLSGTAMDKLYTLLCEYDERKAARLQADDEDATRQFLENDDEPEETLGLP
jgi:hypothetical protein